MSDIVIGLHKQRHSYRDLTAGKFCSMYFYAPMSLTVKRVTEGDKPGGVQEKMSSVVIIFLIVFFVVSIRVYTLI